MTNQRYNDEYGEVLQNYFKNLQYSHICISGGVRECERERSLVLIYKNIHNKNLNLCTTFDLILSYLNSYQNFIQKCVNDVISFINSVTLSSSTTLNLVFSKFTDKMKKQDKKLNLPDNQTDSKEENILPGYPVYPDSEDIYKNFREEEEINPEDTSKTKNPNSNNIIRKNYLDEEQSENDLDIPGSDLDDQQENIGSEDEENNYYSIGGDDHIDLDEEQEENNI